MRPTKIRALISNRESALDLKISISIIFVSLLTVETAGDYLFIGTWYYATTFAFGLALGTTLYPKPFFLSGVITAFAFTFWLYVQHNTSSGGPDGLLVLGHIFSLPGAFLGLIASSFCIKKINKNHITNFAISAAGVLAGFTINQTIICSTLMSCPY
ncbi:hypothetical protein HNP29_003196 [Pseudomonas alcaligenes]|nr:hypothetical protein [Pseudomonas alcaligenes]